MVTRINSELAGGLGNLLSRSLTMIDRFAGGIVPSHDPAVDTPLEHNLMQRTGELLADADKHVEQLRFSRALESIGEILQLCDQYIDKTAPWALAKKPEQRPYLNNCLYHLAHTLGLLIRPLYPFIPSTIVNMARQLGMDPQPRQGSSAWKDPSLLPGTKIQKAGLLFPRIEMTTLQGDKPVSDGSATPQPATPLPSTTTTPTPPAPAAPPQITIDEFSKIQLKTATVLCAERVPKSEKLVKLQVDLGHERRQIVAGIGKKYDPSDLVGKTIVIVANLKPAKLMGIESQGMVLAAGDTDVQGLVTVLEPVAPGTKVK
jgi:methionyl-tRNA synthetase